MKRVLGLAAVLVVGGLAAAAAATGAALGTLALHDHPSLAAPANITLDATGVEGDSDYIVYQYQGSGCDSEPLGNQTATSDVEGNSFSVEFDGLAAGVYSFQAYYDGGDSPAVTNCLDVTIGAGGGVLAPAVSNAFLCYSAFQDNPGVWPMSTAATLLKQGYWSPYAIPGNVTGGTNIGGYHLTCNLASNQSATDSTLGGAAETYGAGVKPDIANVPGHYPIVGA